MRNEIELRPASGEVHAVLANALDGAIVGGSVSRLETRQERHSESDPGRRRHRRARSGTSPRLDLVTGAKYPASDAATWGSLIP